MQLVQLIVSIDHHPGPHLHYKEFIPYTSTSYFFYAFRLLCSNVIIQVSGIIDYATYCAIRYNYDDVWEAWMYCCGILLGVQMGAS